MLLLSLVVSLFASALQSRCRCLPGDPCWDLVDWSALNNSVSGRLAKSTDVMQPCVSDPASAVCTIALNKSDDEFWLSGQPNGFMHTGLFGVWNTSADLSAYSVLAETEEDFVATVRFAARYNLRLVVKGTGHDWLGRSTAHGSLLLWTHLRKNMTWHTSFPAPEGHGVPAVTVQSGAQLADVYRAAEQQPFPGDTAGRRTQVMGGLCDSVGVGGCWLGGCFGTFTKKFGNGAVNMLQARVVLPNGTLITTSETQHPDVFWTLRGGGGGNIAVVTQFTVRTHPAPNHMVDSSVNASATTLAGFRVLMDYMLQANADAVAWSSAPGVQDCGDGGPWFDSQALTAGFGCTQWEGDAQRTKRLYQPIMDWCAAQEGIGIKCQVNAEVFWNRSRPDTRPEWHNISWVPWVDVHPDQEVSTAILGSLSKLIPMRGVRAAETRKRIIDAQIRIDALLANMSNPRTGVLVYSEVLRDTQSGMPAHIVDRFRNTPNNPALLDAAGLWQIMINIPSLPSLGPWSSAVLKTLWPRLQTYAIRSPQDELWAVCEAGATGDEAKAKACYEGWMARVPWLTAQVDLIRQELWQAFPNELPVTPSLPPGKGGGDIYSGSYWNQPDYMDLDFTVSLWGRENYRKLLELKKRYDPEGLFYGHNAVGSELWDASGNCRID